MQSLRETLICKSSSETNGSRGHLHAQIFLTSGYFTIKNILVNIRKYNQNKIKFFSIRILYQVIMLLMANTCL